MYIILCVLTWYLQGTNQNAASAGSGGSVGGERVGNGSEVVSPGGSSTLHGHGGGSEMREITV